MKMAIKDESKSLAEALRDSQFHDLDMDTKNQILVSWVRTNKAMNDANQKSPIWEGSVPMVDIMNNKVVAKTERGEMVGEAIYITTMLDSDGVYKHGVVVHVPASGSVFVVPGRNVKLAGSEDVERMTNEISFAKKLQTTAVAAEEIVIQKRSKRISGSHLLEPMLDVAKEKKLIVEDKSGWFVITGNAKGVAAILARKGGQAHLRGFSVDMSGIKVVTEQEAKERHIGKVRGEIDFDQDDATILKAWREALTVLG